MKTIILIITILLCVSCKRENEEFIRTLDVCNCEEKVKLQQFINDKVIKASNNMSDEEMEDVIFQLEQTGINIYCHKKTITLKRIGDYQSIVDTVKSKITNCDHIMDHY